MLLQCWLSCGPRGIDPPCPECAEGNFSNCWNFTDGRLTPGIHVGNSSDATGGWKSTTFKGYSDGAGTGVAIGLALLGFSSVFREGFETVLFLQNARLLAGTVDRPVHARRHDVVGLAPRRLEGVVQMPPGARLLEDSVPDADPLALEHVVGLDQLGIDLDLESMAVGDRCRRLLAGSDAGD